MCNEIPQLSVVACVIAVCPYLFGSSDNSRLKSGIFFSSRLSLIPLPPWLSHIPKSVCDNAKSIQLCLVYKCAVCELCPMYGRAEDGKMIIK